MINKFHSVIIRAFFILLLISGMSAAYYFWPATNERNSSPRLNVEIQDDNGTATGDSSLLARQPADSLARNDNVATSATQSDKLDSRLRGNDSIAQRYNATIIAGDRTYSLSVAPSTTVYDAMRQLAADSRQPFTFSAKNYPSMGYFVEEINGIKNDTAHNIYWIMYINGQSAPVGASAYILQPNDTVAWKFEKAKF